MMILHETVFHLKSLVCDFSAFVLKFNYIYRKIKIDFKIVSFQLKKKE